MPCCCFFFNGDMKYESILINPPIFGSGAILALQFVKTLCNLESLCAANKRVHFSIWKPCEGSMPVRPNVPCCSQCFQDSKYVCIRVNLNNE